MTSPNLKEIFFSFDFTDDTIPELEAAHSESAEILSALRASHNLTLKEFDKLDSSITREAVMSQYMGFIQGFEWAVSLFTGHITREEKAQ